MRTENPQINRRKYGHSLAETTEETETKESGIFFLLCSFADCLHAAECLLRKSTFSLCSTSPETIPSSPACLPCLFFFLSLFFLPIRLEILFPLLGWPLDYTANLHASLRESLTAELGQQTGGRKGRERMEGN